MMRATVLMFAALVAVSACGAKEPAGLQGYAEADYIYLSPRDPGIVDRLAVEEGQDVEAGALIFAMDKDRAQAGLDRAKATQAASGGTAGASAQVIAEARAAAELARLNLERTRALFKRDYVSKARLDQDQTSYQAAIARVRAAEADRGAAGSNTRAAGADVALAREQVDDRVVRAPLAGRVEQIYRRPGEFAPAGQPVIALLAPENIKLRFFAPQNMLAKLKLGQTVRISCDGCTKPIEARISFIASEPQFTPPVIYSIEQRDKLVYLVEAKPVGAQSLRPGQPIDVGFVS